MIVKLEQSVVISPRSNIEHEAQLRLEELADTLEEPLVRVDLAVVAVLDAKADVNAPSFKDVIGEADIPSRYLENVQKIVGNVFVFDTLVHDVTKGAHADFSSSNVTCRKTLLLKDRLVEEALFPRELLKAVRYAIETIADDED